MSHSKKIPVSVIICTYNRERYIAECLTAILKQSVPSSDYEVIVVNNNSTDQTGSICQDIVTLYTGTNLHYFVETNQGLSHARNRGISEANGEIIAFIDDDAIAIRTFVSCLITFFNQHPNVLASGGRIYPRFENKRPNWLSFPLMPLISVLDMGNHPKKFRRYASPVGANMAFRRNIVEIVGLFNTSLGRNGGQLQGGEETDFFSRIHQYKRDSVWYNPDSVVYHVIPSSRLTVQFIQKLAIGIGQSLYIRSVSNGRIQLTKSYLKEFLKWLATFLISIGYLCIGSLPKSIMLIRFRWWVSSGLFNHSRQS